MNESRMARDEALEQVAGNNVEWMQSYLDFVMSLPSGWTGTAEDLRRLSRDTIGHPKHHNCWGAAANAAIRRNLIVKTGRYLQMRFTESHARSTPEYKRL